MQKLVDRSGQRQEKKCSSVDCWTSGGSSCVGLRSKCFKCKCHLLCSKRRLLGLPDLSQTVAFNCSLKSIGAVVLMAHWLN